MKADFSRLVFDPARHDDEWLQQQGRVWLDSDWNEAALARLRLLELRLTDIVGPTGRPVPGSGFRLAPDAGGGLRIGAGRLYVDGVLCRNDTPTAYSSQPDLPSAPALPLPVPSSGGWSLADDLRQPRARHLAIAFAGATRVLACGGWHAGATSPTAEVYNAETGAWRAVESMRVARAGHTGAALAGGAVVIAGGSGSGGIPLRSAEVFDPDTGTWSRTGRLEDARAFATAVALPDGRVLIAGGIDGGTFVASAELYDPATGTWTTTGSMATPRVLHSATLLPDGRVLVIGGRTPSGVTGSTELFQPSTGTWSPGPPLATARERHAATASGTGVLVTGGAGAGGALTSVERFAAGAWTARASLAEARSDHTASLLADGSVLVAGGLGPAGASARGERYDPGSNSWTSSTLAEARFGHSATVLEDGNVLVAGGGIGGGGGWEPPPPPEVPTAELFSPAATAYGIAYVEAWRRLITYQHDDTREIALGGPDTTVRLRTVAQVRVVAVPRAHQPANLGCNHSRAYLPRPGGGRLSTVDVGPQDTDDECEIPAEGIFSGRENRLYRVEIHDRGEIPGVIRANAAALAAAVRPGALELDLGTLSDLQRASLLFDPWVLASGSGENARSELLLVESTAGARVRLAAAVRHSHPAGATLTRVEDAIALSAAAVHDTRSITVSPALAAELVPASGALARRGWILRSGAEFENVAVIAVDTATGVVTLADPLTRDHPLGAELVPRARFKWSRDNAAFAVRVTGVLTADPGVPGTSAPSLRLRVDSLGRDSVTALRLGDIVELIGDRAELGPGAGLLGRVTSEPDPDDLTLTVDVYAPELDPASTPADPQLAGALAADHLLLRRWDGIGFVRTDPFDLGDGVHIAFSGGRFRAADYWWFASRAVDGSLQRLDAAPPDGVQRQRAPLAILRWSGQPGAGVHVTDCVPEFDPLSGLRAERIAYDDHACDLHVTTVQEALDVLCSREAEDIPYDDSHCRLGVDNVQDAIDALCHHELCPVVDDIGWRNDRDMTRAQFLAGLSVEFSETMSPATLTGATFVVTLEVPTADGATASVIPGGAITCADRTCLFTPAPGPVDALLDGAADAGAERVRCRVTLKGNTILDVTGERPLDGEAFGRLVREGYEFYTDLVLPSGDRGRGGDFESWFYLAAPPAPIAISELRPSSGAVLADFPADILVTFTKDVRLDTLSAATFTVVDDLGTVVSSGRVNPFPFTPGAETASRVTLDLVSTPALQARLSAGDVTFEIRLVGSGGTPVRDVDGLALGAGSDFTSTFTVSPGPDIAGVVWAVGTGRDVPANLFAIQTSLDRARLTVLDAASDFQTRLLEAELPFAGSELAGAVAGVGRFNASSVEPDLFLIRPGGELIVLTGGSGYQDTQLRVALPVRNPARMRWLIGDVDGDDLVDIVAIDVRVGSRRGSAHVLSAADRYGTITFSSALATDAGQNVRWALATPPGGGPADLLSIQAGTASVEIQRLPGLSRFEQAGPVEPTPIPAAELADHRWVGGDLNADSAGDVFALRIAGSPGRATLRVLDGAQDFHEPLLETEVRP